MTATNITISVEGSAGIAGRALAHAPGLSIEPTMLRPVAHRILNEGPFELRCALPARPIHVSGGPNGPLYVWVLENERGDLDAWTTVRGVVVRGGTPEATVPADAMFAGAVTVDFLGTLLVFVEVAP